MDPQHQQFVVDLLSQIVVLLVMESLLFQTTSYMQVSPDLTSSPLHSGHQLPFSEIQGGSHVHRKALA
jgi:hypothetical protein